jgi:tRNA (guanine-N7-)-methyltransferase
VSEAPAASRDHGAFFGRRKGKRLRAAQEERIADLLPSLRIDAGHGPIEPRGLFAEPVEEVWLEIGFGGGEHLAAQIAANPRAGFIGCEPFVNGAAKFLGLLPTAHHGRVRLWDADATLLLPRLAAGSLARIVLLYPDPWPKRRQRKRRFVSDATLAEFVRLLAPDGEFRFASDIDDYAGWTLAHARRCAGLAWTAERAADWREPWAGWPGTRYEAKAKTAGRAPTYLTFARA